MSSNYSSPVKGANKQITSKIPNATPLRGNGAKRGLKPGSNGSTISSAPGSPTILSARPNMFSPAEEDDSVKVIVRIRPLNEREQTTTTAKPCVTLKDGKTVVLEDPSRAGGEYVAHYDSAMGAATSQDDMFSAVGLSVVEHCMSGFNSSIFAYGQTGAGKTHTMIGEASRDGDGSLSPSCGLVPRVFEALFSAISQREQDHPLQSLRYSVKCSFLEIYNEEITDLLAPAAAGLQIRDGDLKKGLYVQGLSETEVVNADDVLALIDKGSASRHMAATKMNERSSRSHSVFTATIEAHERTETGLTNIRYAKLNLIDLAGSERTGRSGVTGDRMAEAKSINKSLTVLGRVITALVERQKKPFTHVPYRDSRLTFLLQESLGGNSKTCIIANVSPAADSAAETYSTLVFAANAKSIKNRAVVNEDVMGDMKALQLENARLQRVISELQLQQREGTVAEVETLKQQLEQAQSLFDQNNALINELRAEQNMLKKELTEVKTSNSRLNDEAVQLKCDYSTLSEENERLREEQECMREGLDKEVKRWKAEIKEAKEKAAAEVERVTEEFKELSSSHTAVTAQLEESRAEVRRLQKEAREEAAAAAAQTADLQRETEALKARLAELESESSALRSKLTSEGSNVAKYKRMVGEIGRLIDWAQANSPLPGGNALRLLASPFPAAINARPSSGNSGLIAAFREGGSNSPVKQPLQMTAKTVVPTSVSPPVAEGSENGDNVVVDGDNTDVATEVKPASPEKKAAEVGITTRRRTRRTAAV